MAFDSERAEIRFGCGLSPRIAPPTSVGDMLARLKGPDTAAERFQIPTLESLLPQTRRFAAVRKVYFHPKNEAERASSKKKFKEQSRVMRQQGLKFFGNTVLRRALGTDAMRERLTSFWADHFTAVGRDVITIMAQPIYVEEAIRPHVAGRFADMLKAAITHPVMLVYLDQNKSMGPNSEMALNGRNRKRGLNENLARELLELHSLGVDGPYTQTDVRQVAELLTGLRVSTEQSFVFEARRAEPGIKTIMGVAYGSDTPSLSDVFAFLDDLAVHPSTAAHLARKLAVHFVSDAPDEGMIADMTARYAETDGDLHAVYEVMLSHPAAWDTTHGNVKQPMDFIGSALRALDISPRRMSLDKPSRLLGHLTTPMLLMGQAWGQAPAPDGFPEEDDKWITPQRLAARLQWSMNMPVRFQPKLPDPREFVRVALGSTAPETVRFAAGAAENRAEGIGLVLASPAFQRM